MGRVILITGPPCAGKTTWAEQRKQPEDVVLDADVLGERVMRQRLMRIDHAHADVYVIRCCPGRDARARLAQRLGADEVVLLLPDVDELMSRARQRPSPNAAMVAVRKWLKVEAQAQSLSVDLHSV